MKEISDVIACYASSNVASIILINVKLLTWLSVYNAALLINVLYQKAFIIFLIFNKKKRV